MALALQSLSVQLSECGTPFTIHTMCRHKYHSAHMCIVGSSHLVHKFCRPFLRPKMAEIVFSPLLWNIFPTVPLHLSFDKQHLSDSIAHKPFRCLNIRMPRDLHQESASRWRACPIFSQSPVGYERGVQLAAGRTYSVHTACHSDAPQT